jgi:hypothetical protein
METKSMQTNISSHSFTEPDSISGIFAFDRFYEGIGITRETAHKWSRLGLIETITICGRRYITSDVVKKFRESAERGDFAEKASLSVVSRSTREEQLHDDARNPETADLVADERFKNAPHP